MLQPLSQDLRFPFIEDLVKSYGPYLERLAKDDKYGLICIFAFWLREEAEIEYIIGTLRVTEANFDNLFGDLPVSSTAQAILKKYLYHWNEPIMQSLITALVQQLREGYYREREIDELEDIHMEPYCDLSDYSSFTDEDVDPLSPDEN